MDKIVLYTTHCPKCEILKEKLDGKSVAYETCEDTDVMSRLGFMSVPVLRVGDKMLNFADAVKYINSI